MSDDQLERASTTEDDAGTSAMDAPESANGESGRSGLRSRLAARRTERGSRKSEPADPDATQVSSDAAAPAPPRRRRFSGETSAVDDGGEATVATAGALSDLAPPPKPLTKRDPVAYSVPHAEAEAVLLDEPAPDDHTPRDMPRDARTIVSPGYGERRVRQTVTKVDLWSVIKLSLCFYISTMFVTIVAMVALWLIADAAGTVRSLEDFLGDLLESKDFTFLSGDVLRGTILIGLVVVALQVVITVIAASFYNIFAELFGGLEITVKEEEDLC